MAKVPQTMKIISAANRQSPVNEQIYNLLYNSMMGSYRCWRLTQVIIVIVIGAVWVIVWASIIAVVIIVLVIVVDAQIPCVKYNQSQSTE